MFHLLLYSLLINITKEEVTCLDKDESFNQSSKQDMIIQKKTKPISKKCQKSRKEWIVSYNNLVDKYDEIQRAYEKCLMVETEKGLELEEGVELLKFQQDYLVEHEKERNIKADDFKVARKNREDFIVQKESLQHKNNALNELVKNDKIKFKGIIRNNNARKVQFGHEVERLRNQFRSKGEKITILKQEEIKLTELIHKQKLELDEKENARQILLDKISKINSRCRIIQQSLT